MKGREECLDSYDEYYRSSEMTSIHELFSYTMSHSVRDYKPKTAKIDSPFTLRVPSESNKDVNSQETNPNISGKDSTSSQTSTCSSESESESSDVDGTSVSDTSEDSTSMVKSKDKDWSVSQHKGGVSHMNGPGLHKYSPNHKDTWMYERYVRISDVCQTPPRKEDKAVTRGKIIENLVFPKSVFKLGSSYGVEPPPVNKQDQDIYHHYVSVGHRGPIEPSKKEAQFYNKYLNKFY